MAIPNRSRAAWGDDAGEVVPERWDRPQGGATSPYAYQGFSSGPRVCIGRSFAMMEIKSFLVELVSRFRLVPSPEIAALGGATPVFQSPSLTLVPKGGLRVGFERL